MIKPIALTFAAAIALAPIGSGAAETAVIGGGAAAHQRDRRARAKG